MVAAGRTTPAYARSSNGGAAGAVVETVSDRAGDCQRPAHWPSLFPATVFGAKTAGVLFLKHSRFPPIVLAATSGVPNLPELPLKSTLPLTVLDVTKGAWPELLFCTIRLPWTTPP